MLNGRGGGKRVVERVREGGRGKRIVEREGGELLKGREREGRESC